LKGILLIDEPKANLEIWLDFDTLSRYKSKEENHQEFFQPSHHSAATNGNISKQWT